MLCERLTDCLGRVAMDGCAGSRGLKSLADVVVAVRTTVPSARAAKVKNTDQRVAKRPATIVSGQCLDRFSLRGGLIALRGQDFAQIVTHTSLIA